MPSHRELAAAMLQAWHGPGLGEVTGISDPRANPLTGRLAGTGSVLTDVSGPARQRVVVLDEAGAPVPVGPDGCGSRFPRWSPDGRLLAFVTDRVQRGVYQLALASADAPGEVHDGPTVPGSIESLVWSPDGGSLMAVVAGYGAEQAGAMGSGRVPVREDQRPEGADAVVRTFPGTEPHDEWRRVWLLSPTGGATCLTAQGPNVWEAAWCGAGLIAAVVSDGPEEDAWYGARFVLLDAGSGHELRVLCTSERQLGVPAASPDGAWAAVVEAPCSDRTLVCGRVRMFDTATGHERAPGLGTSVTHLHAVDPTRVLVSGLDGMRTRIVEYSVSTDTARELLVTDLTVGPREPACWPTPDGGVVFAAEDWHRPPLLAELDPRGVLAERWSAVHDGTASMVERFAAATVVHWTAPDGWPMEGLLALPEGEPPYPLVLYPHGGPVASWRPRFMGGYAIVPLLLSLGYAVAMPNPRGSSGYGWDFADAVHGDMGGKDTDDLLSGIDDLVARGLVDEDRLVVMGGSYAGYMAAWIVTRTDRFKAALASAPVTNWISQHFQSNIPQWGVRFLPDTEVLHGGGYVSRSPVFHAHRVSTPVWLGAGAHDRCCPPTQCLEYHEALRQHGVPTELVIFPTEAHSVPSGSGLYENLERQLDWITRWCPPR